MSKTPFRMPQRDATPTAKLDQWVSGAAEDITAEETRRPERPAGKVARLTIDLSAELHARFKAACALKGTRMINEVRRFIDEWTQKNS
jgi:ParG